MTDNVGDFRVVPGGDRGQTAFIEPVQYPSDVVIERLDAAQIIVEVALVLPGEHFFGSSVDCRGSVRLALPISLAWMGSAGYSRSGFTITSMVASPEPR